MGHGEWLGSITWDLTWRERQAAYSFGISYVREEVNITRDARLQLFPGIVQGAIMP